ncbi:MAG: hypothetical protein M3401_14180 [Actinomycetota bacterium]|nr:hypothetical protein [Actinomycetota bacterium]
MLALCDLVRATYYAGTQEEFDAAIQEMRGLAPLYPGLMPATLLRLWLYTGMSRDVPLPEECPQRHLSRPLEATARRVARLATTRAQERADTPHQALMGTGARR